MRLVPIQSVKEGSILAKTIYDSEGRVLLKEGTELKDITISKIEYLNIYTIYINDKYSDAVIEDVIKPEIRQKAIKKVRDVFYNLEDYNKNQNNYQGQNLYKKSEKDFQSVQYVARELIEEILSRKNVMIGLVDLKSFDDYTYQHSVNVAVIALIIGMKMNFHKYELFDLCIGALLHDIGKVFLPNEILNKPGELTEEERKIVQEHPKNGYDYLKGSYDVSVPARIVALQHHERIGGQGYPEGREGERISILAKIVAVADVYDAMTSTRVYRKALSPNEALEYIMANGGTKFDYKVVQAFSKVVIPYPQGTMIRLSNGDIAIVTKVYSQMPLRPDVKIVYSEIGTEINSIMELSKENSIVINGLEYEVPEDN